MTYEEASWRTYRRWYCQRARIGFSNVGVSVPLVEVMK